MSQGTETLISPVWNKILEIWDTFWAHTNRSKTQQKLFQFFLSQEARASWNNIEKKPQKQRLKLKKKLY